MYNDDADCPICLDPMTPSDLCHPLQCAEKCGYNFCLHCVQSLITSSKDDYTEASDGNMHVKVWLHCPNCRSDLSSTIRDTVLLRRADLLTEHTFGSDESLTATELRFKKSLADKEVQDAIAEARKGESEYLGLRQEEKELMHYERDEYIEEVEEMGVEADLDHGVLNSCKIVFHRRHSNSEEKKDTFEENGNRIDLNLFRGLDFAMTEDEQRYITQLMTSGDVSKVATAAEAMLGVLELSRRGKMPHMRPTISKRSSIYQLIEESQQAKRSDTAKQTSQVSRVVISSPNSRQRRAQHRAMEMSLLRQAEYMKTHPLPVRMPKCVELTLSDPTETKFPLTFCDDTWDGTVMDAYSKISISGSKKKKITRKRTENKAVFRVLNGGINDTNCGDARIEEPRSRVLVASVKNEGGSKGVMKGDVVTHLNGEELGGMTAAELVEELRKHTMTDCANSTFRLVLNAELSTAEALRRRAMIED